MSLLAISVLALALGPLLYRVADRARATLAGLDGFVMVTIAGLVLVHIIPESIAAAGPAALLLALLGFLGPGLVEHNLQRAAATAHRATMILALGGLLVHAFFDGVALAAPVGGGPHGISVLAIAVALHRLPVAITVWWLITDRRLAGSTLVALAAATIAGYALGDSTGALVGASWLGLFQALIAGSLLHVVLHRPGPLAETSPSARARACAGAGALAGIASVAILAGTHLPLEPGPDAIAFAPAFRALALASAPAILLAFALFAAAQKLWPRPPRAQVRRDRGRPVADALRGAGLALPRPLCACGVPLLYRRLVGEAAPATAAMSFLLAAPALGLDAILISVPLLGAELAAARVVCAALLALVVAVVLARAAQSWGGRAPAPAPVPAAATSPTPAPAPGSAAPSSAHYGIGAIIDHTGPWLLLGLAVAALAEPLLRAAWLAKIPAAAAVALFALLGIPGYVCASAAIPLAAVLIHKGVSPGAAIAFLLAGPAINLATFRVLADLHGRRVATAFGGLVAAAVVGLGLLANAALPTPAPISLAAVAARMPRAIEATSLAALAALFAASVLRQGPRAFIGQVLFPYGGHHHDHGAQEDRCASSRPRGQAAATRDRRSGR